MSESKKKVLVRVVAIAAAAVFVIPTILSLALYMKY